MCAAYARACGEQAIGHAGHPRAYFLFEEPTPWPHRLFETCDDLRSLQALRMRLYESGFLFSAIALAPDSAYSQPGVRRVVYLRRPNGPFDRFIRSEYLLPASDDVLPLARAIFDEPDRLPAFDRYRVDGGTVRDLLVCTHGTVDVCCGKFGYPVYQSLRDRYTPDTSPGIRVWRASHFGGHRFAPTMLDLAEGRYSVWSRVAEGEAFRREGWDWLDYSKAISTLRIDEERRAEVRIDFTGDDGRVCGTYEATVELAASNPMPLCGERPDEAHYEGRTYQITHMDHTG
jgi:hypothetical protein